MDKNENTVTDDMYSIGDVVQATGINVFTLRMWERRYGAPYSIKLASGHRRYSSAEIARLRLVKIAIEAGHKPSQVVTLSEQEMHTLLHGKEVSPKAISKISENYIVEKVIEDLAHWDDQALFKSFEEEWSALGPIGFVSDRITVLLKRIGDGWSYGEIPVAAEHFFSELLRSFLSEKWQLMNKINNGPKIIVAALPEEQHSFGLHMASTVLAAVNHKVIFLGTSVPTDDIARASRENNASGLCISVSQYFDHKEATTHLRHLRKSVDEKLTIVLGGSGATQNIEGILNIQSLKSFYEWLRSGGFKKNEAK